MYVLVNSDGYDTYEMLACSKNKKRLEKYLAEITEPSRVYDKLYEEWRDRGVKIVREFVANNKRAVRKLYHKQTSQDACDYVTNHFSCFDGGEFGTQMLETYFNKDKLKSPIPVIGLMPKNPIPYYAFGELTIREVKEI